MLNKETITNSIKLRPKYENLSKDLIDDIVNDVLDDVRNFIHYTKDEEIPTELTSVVKSETMRRLNRIGYEGVSNYSFSGISTSFTDGLTKDELRLLKRKRRLI